MLRLQRSANQEVTLSLGARSKFWTPTLLKAFAVALGIHTLAFCLFSVVKILQENPLPTLPIYASVEEESGQANASPKPRTESFSWLTPLETQPEISTQGFSTMEGLGIGNASMVPLFFSCSERPDAQPIEIHACGELATKLLNPVTPPSLPALPEGEYRALFDVRVEEATGTPFWIHMREGTGSSALNRWAEEAISQLKFFPNAMGFICSGQVEVFVRVGGG